MPGPTLFQRCLDELHLGDWTLFAMRYEATARYLSHELKKPEIASATVAENTFRRWAAGWQGTPQNPARIVLEKMLGHQCDRLFSPAPEPVSAKESAVRRRLQAVDWAVGRWPTSRLFAAAAEDTGTWELAGRNVLDGTAVAVQAHPATSEGIWTTVVPTSAEALHGFLRPARRGFLLGVEGHADPRVYVIDGCGLRRQQYPSGEPIAVPRAYELDDLTFGLVWSLVQFDDGLLADDLTLAEQQPLLDTYLALPRSAPGHMALPTLTSVAASWTGSAFCARYLRSHLEGRTETPVFWTREQTGEQASAWLFFQHKVEYLKELSGPRVFAIPEEEVARSGQYEKILLFLAVALMERWGSHVRVTARPEYTTVDGFALSRGDRVVVANWVRTDEVWAAETITRGAVLREYQQAFMDASEHNVMEGSGPEQRLRALAGYLSLPWAWLVQRCRDLGDVGVSALLRPRSRHLTVRALEETLRFVGAFSHRG
ncbi:hypothetical protein [Streptomyces aureocirculatus]|uniref:hypothetical protein n=1 Tax=Streptomyces aureocirculatus TaxID=67275 RepID=UPI0004C857EB|nr:hypothetical protein [Streptomyces aureocirculatus]